MTEFDGKGPDELQQDVLISDMCCGCGACENICPYIDVVEGKSIFIASCDQDEGDCYKYCPMTFVDIPFLESKIFNFERDDPVLGYYKTVKKVRALRENIGREAQYGGVTSALVHNLLKKGRVDRFILTEAGEGWGSYPRIVEEPDEILNYAKSKYTSSPNISKLNEVREEPGRIGMVGTPCQITAARKMEVYGEYEFGPLIGLFCTWALKKDFLDYMNNVLDLGKVEKFDIPPPPAEKLLAYTSDDVKEISLDEVKDFVMPSCNSCMDMTSELADISVGQVEGANDWNTVILRSDEGEKIFNKATEDGVLKVEDLEDERLNHLREAAGGRKKRVLEEAEGDNRILMREEDINKIKKVEF